MKIDICGEPAIVLPDIEPCTNCEAMDDRIDSLEQKTYYATDLTLHRTSGNSDMKVVMPYGSAHGEFELDTSARVDEKIKAGTEDAVHHYIKRRWRYDGENMTWYLTEYQPVRDDMEGFFELFTHSRTPISVDCNTAIGDTGFYRTTTTHYFNLPEGVKSDNITNAHVNMVSNLAGMYVTVQSYPSREERTVHYYVIAPSNTKHEVYIDAIIAGLGDVDTTGWEQEDGK